MKSTTNHQDTYYFTIVSNTAEKKNPKDDPPGYVGGQHVAEEYGNEGCVVWRSARVAQAAWSCRSEALAEQDENRMQAVNTDPP